MFTDRESSELGTPLGAPYPLATGFEFQSRFLVACLRWKITPLTRNSCATSAFSASLR